VDAGRRDVLIHAALALAVTVAGCSGGAPSSEKQLPHAKAIAVLYFKAVSTLGRAPKSEAEFKQVISQGTVDFDVLGVSTVDELFVSDRDNEPLVIIYGESSKGASPGVVAYEQTGKDGKRLVATNNGQVVEADAARFGQLVPSYRK
jgi:hypothetical protein